MRNRDGVPKRHIGDNQNPIQESAIDFIRKNYERLIVLRKYCAEAYGGRNKTIRDVNALNSLGQINAVVRDLESWAKIILALDKGYDIDGVPLKKHKLKIVSDEHHKFGQYVVDNEK